MTPEIYELLNEYLIIIDDFASAYSTAIDEMTLSELRLGEFLAPFIQEAYETLLPLAQKSTSEEAWIIRGSAVAGVSTTARCMGKEVLLTKIPQFAPLMVACFAAGEDAMAETQEAILMYVVLCICHIRSTRKKLGEDFEPYVEPYLQFLERAFQPGKSNAPKDEEKEEEVEDGMPTNPTNPTNPESESDQAVDEERVIALGAYLSIVKALGPKFIPYQQRCFTMINEHCKTYKADVQNGVCELITQFPTYLYPAETKPTSGVDMPLAELIKQRKNYLA